jgi:ADP-ribosyl-[dinitrogen reductase] hydrolase
MHTPPISPRFSEKARAGVWGFIVGDALGVPFEFKTREDMYKSPATGMTGGGMHDQPPGTWSDDTSMMLCVMENGHDGGGTYGLADLFLRWAYEGYQTPHGEVFDIGVTTRIALEKYKKDKKISGLNDERSAGNGSLMRCLPYAFREAYAEGMFYMVSENRITHRNWLCQHCCIFYTRMVRALAEGDSKELSLKKAGGYLRHGWRISDQHDDAMKEASRFNRLFDESFPALPEKEIRSGGYVIESLETSVWSFMNGTDYRSTVLKAVNLGEDTDTNAALAGGLAAIHYGMRDIPSEWLETIVGRKELEGKIDTWIGLNGEERGG